MLGFIPFILICPNYSYNYTYTENINVVNKEIKNLDQFKNEIVIVATGPLTSKNLTNNIKEKTSETSLAFYDAIAPIVYKDSIDMSIAWKQSRYDKGEGDDYINCPLNKSQYYDLINLIKKSPKQIFDKKLLTNI